MNPFAYTRVTEVAEAVEAISSDTSARFIAGGTNLLDLMKERVEQPGRLVDITHLPLGDVEVTASGGLRLGALATNTEVAYHALVERRYPLLSKAILAGASAQLGTWRPSEAICSNVPGVCTFTTGSRAATSERPARVVPPSRA